MGQGIIRLSKLNLQEGSGSASPFDRELKFQEQLWEEFAGASDDLQRQIIASQITDSCERARRIDSLINPSRLRKDQLLENLEKIASLYHRGRLPGDHPGW